MTTQHTGTDDALRSTESLLIERRGRTTILTLNRPDALNSIDAELAEQLRNTWHVLAHDPQTWVVVVTGAGNRAFCTGSDLKKTPPPPESFAQTHLSGLPTQTDFLPPRGFVKPIIAAINGHAVGGGLELALSLDIQIAAPNAKLGLPELKVGSLPGAGGTQRIARRVPMGIAQRMVLTAELLPASQALQYGLVSEVVESEQLLDRALEIADRIHRNAPLAVRAAKRALYAAQDVPLEQGLEIERLLWGALRDTTDRAEGRAAFAEKRTPDYEGR